jgi:hypothetical protein
LENPNQNQFLFFFNFFSIYRLLSVSIKYRISIQPKTWKNQINAFHAEKAY